MNLCLPGNWLSVHILAVAELEAFPWGVGGEIMVTSQRGGNK